MVKKKKKTKALTKKQLDILYECWKNGETTKERLVLIEEKLPKIPSLAALSIMRKMAKTETKWLKMVTRKKNHKEKEKLTKKKEREKKKLEKEKRKRERVAQKAEKEKVDNRKTKLNKIKSRLKNEHMDHLQEQIEARFFFCNDFQHYVNNLACIYRVFSNECGFSLGLQCEKCSRMNKYMPIIEEIIKNDKKQGTEKHKTSKRRRKTKKKRTKKASSRKKKS